MDSFINQEMEITVNFHNLSKKEKKVYNTLVTKTVFPLTLLETGGMFNTPPTDTQNGFQMTPNSYFYMTDLKSKIFFLVFHSDFGCLEGGVANPPAT